MQGAWDEKGGSEEMRNSYQEDRLLKDEGNGFDRFGCPEWFVGEKKLSVYLLLRSSRSNIRTFFERGCYYNRDN